MPALPPVVNGLGDYATVLANELQRLGVASRFVTAGMPPRSDPAANVGDWLVDRVAVPEPRALLDALERAGADTVLLHYSGYGYARWGLCVWLLQGLRRWKAASRRRRLVTMFHELYAAGPPWSSSFWTSWPQRRIAYALADISDGMVCGYALVQRRLQAWNLPVEVHCLPVFSNVGELDEPPPLAAREAVAVVFGGAGVRARTYASLARHTTDIGRLGIARIVDIGPLGVAPPAVGAVPVEPMGVLPSEAVSAIMRRAKVGLVDYPLHVIAKSGVIAAFHAHGLLCVNLSDISDLHDDVVEGVHFIGLPTLQGGGFDAQAIAAAGLRWYRGHDLERTASLVAGLLQPRPIRA